MRMLDPADIEFKEDENGMQLHFKKGVDPQVLIDLIDDINKKN